MSTTGLVHTVLALVAMLIGGVILSLRKATPTHVWLGRAYVLTMLGMNGSSFFLQSFLGRFGVFHVLSVVSLLMVVGGLVPVLLRRPRRTWIYYHYYLMLLSYVGLLAAAASEVVVRLLPPPGSWAEFWVRVNLATLSVSVVGTYLVIRLQSRTFARLGFKPAGRGLPSDRPVRSQVRMVKSCRPRR
jgi:uncharacterized membrane protein